MTTLMSSGIGLPSHSVSPLLPGLLLAGFAGTVIAIILVGPTQRMRAQAGKPRLTRRRALLLPLILIWAAVVVVGIFFYFV